MSKRKGKSKENSLGALRFLTNEAEQFQTLGQLKKKKKVTLD